MIYTVTFNPSLDYVVQIENLTLGKSIGRLVRRYIPAAKETMCL